MDEQQCIRLAQRGEVAAFESLVKAYEGPIYNLAYRMLGNAEDAMDATQDTFLKAYSALPRFRGDASFSTWLYRIAKNVCLDRLRHRKRHPTVSLDDPMPTDDGEISRQVSSSNPDPEDLALSGEIQDILDRALGELPSHHRAVIVLRDLQGFSYEEIADVLEIELGTVKSRLYRARTALHDRLAPMELFSDRDVNRSERREEA